ncbi:hypothetical protein BKE38_19925 [Pseudoroseomonas deserti]|uniref:Alpha 1,4-glycosyltransferase domain-containing protein n=1 Tax=Teichococcus deserti TaxID=1817963 RepID=A0A1V2GYS7_9PROT|nr:hypothetical protein BKE38_19925 [Pseudoroseomonas deserti]
MFQSYWHGGPLSPYEWLCLKSFVDHGHAFHLYSHDPQLAVPEGVQLMDAADILPATDIFVHAHGWEKGSVACFADLFRYELLLQRGNWWVDTDICCLRPQVPAQPFFAAFEAPDRANNAVLHFEAGHAVMRDCRDGVRRLGPKAAWGQTGPELLTATLKQHGLLGAVAPAATCYPFGWKDALMLFDPEQAADLRDRIGGAFCIHFWNEILRRLKIDKRLGVPRGSYLDALFARHGVRFPAHVGYTMATIAALLKSRIELEQLTLRAARLEAALKQSEARAAELLQANAALRDAATANGRLDG